MLSVNIFESSIEAIFEQEIAHIPELYLPVGFLFYESPAAARSVVNSGKGKAAAALLFTAIMNYRYLVQQPAEFIACARYCRRCHVFSMCKK